MLDFGSLTGSCPALAGLARCSRRGGWAAGGELVARLGAPSPSASGATTVAGQVQVGCCQVQVECFQVQVEGCRCVQEQVVCCQGAEDAEGQVVDRGVLCTHSVLDLRATAYNSQLN